MADATYIPVRTPPPKVIETRLLPSETGENQERIICVFVQYSRRTTFFSHTFPNTMLSGSRLNWYTFDSTELETGLGWGGNSYSKVTNNSIIVIRGVLLVLALLQ